MADDLADDPKASQPGGWPAWPAYALIDDLLPTLERWSASGRRYALATLIEVVGSSPRPVGSEMAVADDGEMAGYVSGGCVEAAVASEALAALADGRPRLLDYGAGSPVLDVQLSCGGRIRILVRAVDDGAGYAARLRRARVDRSPLSISTDLETGAIHFEAATVEEGLGAARYLRRQLPPLRLILVGGDPIVLALLQMAPMFSVETVLLRPRGPAAGASLQYVPALYDRRGIEAALADLHVDSRCAIYTLSHDVDTDHAVLAAALRSPAYCIGALGSRRKAQTRVERLRAEGFDEIALARLRTPAGLNIGARSPQEIALSILGELIAERRPD
ncbi:MAG: Xanthine dehydrogenase accessory factor [Hydrocarboniphaga sp.]|uniref:XdhC family protein n=1 Tax=Hydrocarboniphaga sp. TaxID=2033016 RepID=UPI0026041D21|nr:XdhC family protein [Hydrocarboniphaga sp.]MDB5968228.1 Xanthine dehydrogenase accessory factor [Hydrocarboniphaga sp.]